MRLSHHTAFSGNATELADLAVDCGQGLRLTFGTDKINERLVRYYVTEGVLDRPERVGRDAAYGYRHLLQLLTARRMADAGITLAAVAHHNQAATTQSLEEGLSQPLPTAAEILINEFMGSTQRKGAERSSRHASAPARPGNARPPMALPDVLAAVEHMKAEVMGQVKNLEMHAMNMTQQVSDRQQRSHHERHELLELRALVHEGFERLHHTMRTEVEALRHENARLGHLVTKLIDQMQALNGSPKSPPPPQSPTRSPI